MKLLRLLIGIFASVNMAVVLMGSPAHAQPAFDPPGLDIAIAAQERHTVDLLEIQGVVGTGIGVGADGGAVVKIYTETVGVGRLPKNLNGVPVVVQVTGKIQALHHREGHGGGGPPGGGGGNGGGEEVDPTSRFDRPVPIGVSSGNAEPGNVCAAGTLGARVTDGLDVYALSNNHVYALENTAAIGEPITQPGALDTGCIVDLVNDVVGTLAAFVPILFDGTNNTVDAAIALDSTGSVGNSTPLDGYGTPKSAIVLEAVGESVQKYGRTSSLTKGTINGINVTINVGYDSGVATFVGQIEVESDKGPFIKAGDSGSLLVTDPGRNPVGLLFAGNKSGKTAFANPIDAVLTALGVSVDGE